MSGAYLQTTLMHWAANVLTDAGHSPPVAPLQSYGCLLDPNWTGAAAGRAMEPIFEIVPGRSADDQAKPVTPRLLALDTILPDPDCAAVLD